MGTRLGIFLPCLYIKHEEKERKNIILLNQLVKNKVKM